MKYQSTWRIVLKNESSIDELKDFVRSFLSNYADILEEDDKVFLGIKERISLPNSIFTVTCTEKKIENLGGGELIFFK